MGNPRAVETVVSFPLLVPAPFVESDGSGRLVTPIRYERGHAADRMRAAVAGADEQVGIRPHERRRHGHCGAIR
jgi:hypothetical protein